jgi:hypothetical protein
MKKKETNRKKERKIILQPFELSDLNQSYPMDKPHMSCKLF